MTTILTAIEIGEDSHRCYLVYATTQFQTFSDTEIYIYYKMQSAANPEKLHSLQEAIEIYVLYNLWLDIHELF